MLIDFIEDWYLYSFGIIDPSSTQWILDQLKNSSIIENSDAYGKTLKACIALLARHLAAYRGPVFCYSVPEYNSASVFFSITSDRAEGADEVRKAVKKLIAAARGD